MNMHHEPTYDAANCTGAPARRFCLQKTLGDFHCEWGDVGLSSDDLEHLRTVARDYLAAREGKGHDERTRWRIVDGNYTPGIVGGHVTHDIL